ncbi:hypothetical protein PVAP13_4NG243200 [Panicum virgatum]|uniref:Uncharacterized protein n=1 Tax=Panicum virgatum TaxID=38727 RepID=A0A8T0TDU3_PANVG|nr:hypothetical protein PVAP13_4NG243200 [Panicum virgatum]
MTDIPKSRARQLVMQPLNCISFLLGLAILSATLGPFVTIAHRELLMVTGSKRGAEIKLDLSVDKTGTDEDVRSNVLTGRKLAIGDAVTEQKDANNSGSKTSSGEIKKDPTNPRAPSNLKLQDAGRTIHEKSKTRRKHICDSTQHAKSSTFQNIAIKAFCHEFKCRPQTKVEGFNRTQHII